MLLIAQTCSEDSLTVQATTLTLRKTSSSNLSKSTKDKGKVVSIKHQIAVVLAIPIIAARAISKVIAQSYSHPSAQDRAMDSFILIILSLIIGIILYYAPLIGKALGEYGMKVVHESWG